MSIDQIVYCWSPHSLVGTRGVGPIASSLPDEDLKTWNQRLGQEIWAADDPPGGLPGLSYLRYDGDAAVAHKLPVADENGRPGSTFTHVLVGSGQTLTASLALGLAGWDGWHRSEETLPEARVLESLPLSALPLTEPEITGDTFGQAVSLVSRILADPGRCFSVVGATALATALLWVVLAVLRDVSGPWTFATRESAEAGMEGPRLIFLVRDPGFSAHGGHRIRIQSLAVPDDGSPFRDFAEILVDAYRRGGAELVSRVHQRRLTSDIGRWASDVQVAPGVLGDPWWLLTRAARGDVSTRENAFLVSAQGKKFIETALGDAPDPALVRLLSAWDWDAAAPATVWIGDALVGEALRRCLNGDWPAADLLEAVQQAAPEAGRVRLTLESWLPSHVPGLSKADRRRKRVVAIAVARVLDPGLLLTEGEVQRALTEVGQVELLDWAHADKRLRRTLIRMAADTASQRPGPDGEVRTRLELAKYLPSEIAAEYGPQDAVHALGDLLELGYGHGVVKSAEEVPQVLGRLAPDGDEDVRTVLIAIGLRARDLRARAEVERLVAVREFRKYQPDYLSVRSPAAISVSGAAPPDAARADGSLAGDRRIRAVGTQVRRWLPWLALVLVILTFGYLIWAVLKGAG